MSQASDLKTSSHPLLGIALKVAATLIFMFMAVIARGFGDTFPVGQVVFFRSLFAFVPILIVMAVSGMRFGDLKTKVPWSHARRATSGVLAMFTYFASLMYLPIADVTAISFASPLIVVVLAAFILGETVRLYRWSAVAAGFIGVLIMVSPHLGAGFSEAGASAGVILAFTNAFLVAFTMIFIRLMSGSEPALVIAFYFQLACTLVSACTLPFAWATPSGSELVLLVTLGILGGIGQLLMTNAYRFAEASTLANFDYAAMIWAIVLGWLFFSELPAPAVYVGAVIVIGSGLFIVWRERQLGLRRAEATVEPG
ncbi:MAG: DMT family transporter [Micropepsaceae bacterium]